MLMKKVRLASLVFVLVFVVVFSLQGSFPVLLDIFSLSWKALYEPYRFITMAFLHINILHLLSNSISMLFFGTILNNLIGTKKFVSIFFLSVIFSSLSAFLAFDSLIGASGGTYGIIGALFAFKGKKKIKDKMLLLKIAIVGYIIISPIVSSFISSITVIHSLHFVGFLTGFLVQYQFFNKK
jgi:rhomboid protease GluP